MEWLNKSLEKSWSIVRNSPWYSSGLITFKNSLEEYHSRKLPCEVYKETLEITEWFFWKYLRRKYGKKIYLNLYRNFSNKFEKKIQGKAYIKNRVWCWRISRSLSKSLWRSYWRNSWRNSRMSVWIILKEVPGGFLKEVPKMFDCGEASERIFQWIPEWVPKEILKQFLKDYL